ncbi:MAG: four helix bundle protein [Candidatus Levybacteria bacterium]|nr:four helix bundle protein [Candidatus Levybacteria bacterium]
MNQAARSFLDLEVYKSTYEAAIAVNKQIVPLLPPEEKYDLADQLRRASKSIPAVIAEGYARKNHQKDWQKHLDDSIGECNEMITHLSFAKDLYAHLVSVELCDQLIDTYNIAGKRIYTLARSWRNTV